LHLLLEVAPGDANLHYQLGMLLQMQGKNASAKAAYGAALALDPAHVDANNNLGVILKGEGSIDQALQHHQRALAARPGSIDALNNIAVALQALGRTAESPPYFERALALQPDHAGLHYNYAAALHVLARLDEAIDHYRKALQLNPGLVFAHRNLGDALQLRGRLDEAELQFRRALELEPQSPESWYGLGSVQLGLALLTDAVESFSKALALRPEFPEAEIGLGMVQKELGQTAEARAHYLQALQLRPGYADAWDKLGSLHRDEGDLAEAMHCYRKALQIEPGFVNAHHNLCFTMNYAADIGPQEIFEQHLEFARRHCALPRPSGYRNQPDPHRRLRIGYVSGDFRKHAISYFIEPVLAQHEHGQFEVACYYNFFKNDAVTERLRGHADRWENIYGLSDAQAARKIESDGIDILVDLSGHTGFNRLLLFARKPAPVQLTYLGYPATTGMSAMDYRLTDAIVDPPGAAEGYYTERLLRLPHSLWCFRPSASMPEPGPLPALRSGQITFGSLNSMLKLTPQMIALWSRLLLSIPQARLVLTTVAAGEARERIAAEFARHGVPAETLSIRAPLAREQFWALYREIDIALDTYPCNGGATTCEALWSGVPVLSLAGPLFQSRAGLSLLSVIGLPELVAHSESDYLRIARELALDRVQLSQLRRGLRQRMRDSPLLDEARFTRALEALYREAWRRWCEQVGRA
jgi:predicted O-linked N-acetylglucosamine transferase (SPINDLY family)